jgi:hypothetical protein
VRRSARLTDLGDADRISLGCGASRHTDGVALAEVQVDKESQGITGSGEKGASRRYCGSLARDRVPENLGGSLLLSFLRRYVARLMIATTLAVEPV